MVGWCILDDPKIRVYVVQGYNFRGGRAASDREAEG